jgi:hypothetical protein
MWRVFSAVRSPPSLNVASAIKAWKGGELLACLVTVDGSRVAEFAPQYNLLMICGIGRPDAERSADRAISVSKAFTIEPKDFEIEEPVSGPMRVLLAEITRSNPTPPFQQPRRLHEEALWYELALLPKGVDSFAVRTLSDIERLGGRILLDEPRWSTIGVRVP